MMKRHHMLGIALAFAALLAILVGGLPTTAPADPASPAGTVALQAPPFVRVAGAAPLHQTEPPFVSEAGIAAYFQKTDGITITDTIRGLFRTTETEPGLDYVLGQMPISGDYDDQQDAQVYISSSGWVVAYYQRDVPTSKIIDWRAWDTSTPTAPLPTKLETVLANIAATIGVTNPSFSYYHFGFPNANRLTLASDYVPQAGRFNRSTDDFTLTLPASFDYAVGERSWAVAHHTIGYWSGTHTTELLLTNQNVADVVVGSASIRTEGWAYAEGIFEAGTNNLGLGTDQTITVAANRDGGNSTVNGYGGVAVVYRDNS